MSIVSKFSMKQDLNSDNLSYEEFQELIDWFTVEKVDESHFHDPRLTVPLYRDLIIERNTLNMCAWPLCSNKITCPEVIEGAVFCSHRCKYLNQHYVASLMPIKNNPLGEIVEKSPDVLPPKPLTLVAPDSIEGYKVRVGEFHDVLDHIEQWFGGFPVSYLQGLNAEQEKVFECVNESLKKVGVLFKKSTEILAYFVNINVDKASILTTQPENFRIAFAISIYYVLFESDFSASIQKYNISKVLFDDLVSIVSQGMDDDDMF